MEELNRKIISILENNKVCYVATAGRNFVDNAAVDYYSEEFTIYFDSFSDTLKCRNIDINPYVAVCIANIQIHGMVKHIEYNSAEYMQCKDKYLDNFPQYRLFFSVESNELYKIEPLVIWLFDFSKGFMHRDKLVFDEDYYRKLMPYEAPKMKKRGK